MALKGKLLDTGVKPLLTLAASENKEKEQCSTLMIKSRFTVTQSI